MKMRKTETILIKAILINITMFLNLSSTSPKKSQKVTSKKIQWNKKRRTRQTSRKAASPEKKAKVITMDPDAEDICDPLIEGHHVEEGKEKELKSTKNRTETLSDEDSYHSEDEVIPVKKSRSKVEEQNKEDKPNPTKVSMVAAIFRAKKKKQTDSDSEATDTKIKKMATRVLLPKGPKKLDVSVSESDSEKEKEKTEGNTSDIPLDKEAQDEADKLP